MKSQLTLCEVVSCNATNLSSHPALVFLEDGEEGEVTVTYSDLCQRAQKVARRLVRCGLQHQRVFLLFPSGPEYVVAFLGCLYAGVVAVPAYPPRSNWHAQRLVAIARDAGAAAVLTVESLESEVRMRMTGVGLNVPILATDALNDDTSDISLPAINPSDIAYLQYTSGSTGNPKGVIVRHSDLAGNSHRYSKELGLSGGSTVVSWLPIFHDMGLVQGIVLPLMLGGTAVFMPPTAFIQKPLRWLKAIERFGAIFSAAPNFAYELCVDKVSDNDVRQLDLSSWRAALNAAEPIDYNTVSRFQDKFREAGLRPDAQMGGYGLAEATLYVTCGRIGHSEQKQPMHPAEQGGAIQDEVAQSPSVVWVDKVALSQGRVQLTPASAESQPLVSCGWLSGDPQVCIVDTARRLPVERDHIGEIWVSGSTVCTGYWRQEATSRDIFEAKLAEGADQFWLRTGDLGFVHEGQLYVAGRLKDLIIVRGANHYPQDIERTVEELHPALRKGGYCAAFMLNDTAATPHVVIVCEVKRTVRKKVDVQKIGKTIAQAVVQQHGIDVDTVVLVMPSGVPKTSSGKVQRKECRTLFREGKLPEIGRWERSRPQHDSSDAAPVATSHAIEQWLKRWIAEESGMRMDSLSLQQPFSELGLHSIKLVELVIQLGAWLGRSLSPTLVFDHPTIERLSASLAGSFDVADPALRVSPVVCDEPIAIIGIGCRLPGADSVEAYWEIVARGQQEVRGISAERSRLTHYISAPSDPYRWGGFLEEIDDFDSNLFGISPREAVSIDPQQRLVLETTWRALEHAGIPADRLLGTATGVYIGISTSDYFRLQRAAGAGRDAYSGTGTALSAAANRVSYCLGLQGPSMAVDTACSSSLVAVHQACASLAKGESDLALAGGVNLVLSPDYGVIFSQARMLSSSGQCHTFDAVADGYVRGEGCGVVVLKRLRDAERDSDQILAVIRGSAVNQDGRSNGLTAPNGQAQQQVVRTAVHRAGFTPESIGYVETHGTGTPLGDPIEVAALSQVLSKMEQSAEPCWLGAVKPNIGHLESAAGIAGLIKAVLVLQNKQIPPVAGFQILNPNIDLSTSRLQIPTALTSWPQPVGHPRRAGVSAFGFAGTNAHVVLEEYQAPKDFTKPRSQPTLFQATVAQYEADKSTKPCQKTGEYCTNGMADVHLLTLSASTIYSLKQLAAAYAKSLRSLDEQSVAGFCLAAYARRAKLSERLAFVGQRAEIADALEAYARDAHTQHPMLSTGRAKQRHKIAFLFTGQGTQYAQMGQALYQSEPVFRAYVDQCDSILSPLLGRSMRDILLEETDAALLEDQRYAQPVLIGLELALVKLWQHYGVEPDFVVGHSVGEYAAAHTAGMMDLETTLRLVVERGRCIAQAGQPGGMLAVNATQVEITSLLADLQINLDLAAVNAPNQIVLSGCAAEIERAAALFSERQMLNRPLSVTQAFHSRLMEPVIEDFRAAVSTAQLHPPARHMIPTGGLSCDSDINAEYWTHQIRLPVLFHDALNTLVDLGVDTFIEIGPRPVLSRLGKRAFPALCWLSSMEPLLAAQRFHTTRGALFVQGVNVRIAQDGQAAPHVSLPPYPFDHAHYWFSPGDSSPAQHTVRSDAHYLVGRRIELAIPDVICFETVLPGSATYLLDHRIAGQSLMPGSGYASLMVEAARASSLMLSDEGGISLRSLQLMRPMPLMPEGVRAQTFLQRMDDGTVGNADRSWHAKVMAWVETTQSWELHASATLHQCAATRLPEATWNLANDSEKMKRFYGYWSAEAMDYGPSFRAIRAFHVSGQTVQSVLELPPTEDGEPGELLTSALLDAAFQTVGALLTDQPGWKGYMPLVGGIDELYLFSKLGTRVKVNACLTSSADERQVSADLQLYDEEGASLVRISGLQLTRLPLTSIKAATNAIPPQYFDIVWQPAPLVAKVDKPFATLAPWQLLAVGEDRHAFFSLLKAQDWCAHNSAVPDGATHFKAKDWSTAAGLLVYAEPLPAVADPIVYCQEICTRLRGLLGELHDQMDVPQGLSICLLTQEADDAQVELQNMLVYAGLNAMWQSAAQEYTKFALRHVHVGAGSGQREIALLHTYLNGCDETHWIIHQGEVRFVRLIPANLSDSQEGSPIRADTSYLITGGSGGIGLALADWLAASGAGRIVLVSRRAQPSAEMLRLMQSWHERGVPIVFKSVDVSLEDEVAVLCSQLAQYERPLRGVFHAAAILDDKPLSEIGEESWQRVFAAKAASARLLDKYTRSSPLDLFVLFSSVGATIGSSGQCNYAAANGMLDALAHARHRQGLCATVVNWGPWAEIGMASSKSMHERMSRIGLHCIAPLDGFSALRRILARPRHVQTVVAAADWSQVGRHIFGLLVPSVLRGMMSETPMSAPAPELRQTLMSVDKLIHLAGAEIAAQIRCGLTVLLAQVLRSKDAGLLTQSNDTGSIYLSALGIDSLMAMELRNRVKTWINVDLPAHVLIGNTTLDEVVNLLYEKLLFSQLSISNSKSDEADEEVFLL